jgi:hypothetical protein
MKSINEKHEKKSSFLIFFIGILFIIAYVHPLKAWGNSEENHFTDRIINAIRSGSFKGKVGIYYEHLNYDKESFLEDDEIIKLEESNLVVPYFQIEYSSPQYRDFSAGVGLTGYTHINQNSEQKNRTGDPDDIVFHKLFLSYHISQTTLKLGRQSVEDSLFLADYYEAISIHSEEIDNAILNFYLVDKVAESDINEFIEFDNINRGEETIDDFLYAAEVSWDMIEDAVNTKFYFYHQGHLYDLYGAHFTLSHDIDNLGLGLIFDFYATQEDSKNGMKNIHDEVDDTDIYHIRPYLEFHDFSLAAGYIETDRLAGAREGGLIDDYFNPFNEGNNVYEPDAKTWYGTLEYEQEHFAIGLIFGSTDYVDNSQRLDDTEFNINALFRFKERFQLETEFSRVNSDSPEGDYSLFEMALTYEF